VLRPGSRSLPGFERDEGHAEHGRLRAAVNPRARVSIFAHKFLGVVNDLESHIVVAILVVHAGQPIGPEPGTERRRGLDSSSRLTLIGNPYQDAAAAADRLRGGPDAEGGAGRDAGSAGVRAYREPRRTASRRSRLRPKNLRSLPA
jgi:hypothetical protein